MCWKETMCYLCGEDAEELEYSRNLRVRCDNCNTFYYLTSFVRKFRLDNKRLIAVKPSTQEKVFLNDIQKTKLLKHVQENNDPDGRNPVEINFNLINN